MIDLSFHAIHILKKTESPFLEMGTYYALLFSGYLDVFIPFSFLVASLKVWIDLDTGNELLALQTGGVSGKKITIPFFCLAIILSLTLYLNQETFAPASKTIAHQTKSKFKRKKYRESSVKNIILKDNSQLYYLNYDENCLYDIFWIQSLNDIWHFEKLMIKDHEPVAFFADHFLKNAEGKIVKTASYENLLMPTIPIDETSFRTALIPLQNQSLSTLFHQAMLAPNPSDKSLTYFFSKCAQPLILFLIILTFAPIHLAYTRHKRNFLLISIALGLMVIYKALLEGMAILGENSILPPLVAIFSPPIIALAITLPKFLRLDKQN